MRILVLLMFLASLGFSMGLTDDELNEQIDRARLERPYGAEFVESASPACQGIATTLSECNDPKGKRLTEAPWRCASIEEDLRLVCFLVPDPAPCPVSMVSFLNCERKELQRQLREVQGQLNETGGIHF